MLKEVPESMEELKRKATNQSNWRERLEAVNELKNYDCEQSRSILTNLAIHDSVFVVQEAAFRAAQSMKITKNGQPIRLNRKPKGNLVKGINGKLVTVRNSLPEGYTLDEFKKAFQGTVKHYAQIHLQVWQNSVCTGQGNLPLTT